MAWYDIEDWYTPQDQFNLDPHTEAMLKRAWGDDFTDTTAELWDNITERYPELRHDREAMVQIRDNLMWERGDHENSKRRELKLARFFEDKYDIDWRDMISEDDWELLRRHYEEQSGKG